jgi:hypothetical protein
VAVGDSYSTNEDTTLTVGAPGVLGNDTDVDGKSLSATLVAGLQHGTLALNSNGSVSYTPDPNFFGADSYSYTISDGADPVYLDQFIVVKNGVELFNDPFDDGVSPPSAPTFSYFVVGEMEENGGELSLDSRGAIIQPSLGGGFPLYRTRIAADEY